jgi:hypothetical protein
VSEVKEYVAIPYACRVMRLTKKNALDIARWLGESLNHNDEVDIMHAIECFGNAEFMPKIKGYQQDDYYPQDDFFARVGDYIVVSAGRVDAIPPRLFKKRYQTVEDWYADTFHKPGCPYNAVTTAIIEGSETP